MMTGPSGNSELRFSGNKIHCSPRDQSLSVKCLSKELTIWVASYEGATKAERLRTKGNTAKRQDGTRISIGSDLNLNFSGI